MIEVQHISKVFNKGGEDEVRALRDVSVSIKKGDFAMIIGSNGSGKSTFFNIIQGTNLPDEGKVILHGKEITRITEHRRSRMISRVFQNPAMGTAPDLSIAENFRLAALRAGSRNLIIGNNIHFREIVKKRISTLGMGLEKKLDRPMGSLSGGQRQALTLLMGVMDETSVLLMDEPTAALDPKSADTILRLADTMNKETGLTILLITHSLKDAFRYGNRLIQFREGRIAKDLGQAEKEKLRIEEMLEWF